jgi:hypothetical protein
MSHAFAHGYALIIGVDENNVSGYALPDVSKDIKALADVLVHPQRCAYLKDNLEILAGQEATRRGILDKLEWLQERVEADTSGNATAIVYFTGHGWYTNSNGESEYYLIPYDVREGEIRFHGLRATDFAEAVGKLEPRRLLVILDCCHAGGMGVKGATLPTGYTESAISPSLLMGGEKSVSSGAKGLEALGTGVGRAVLSSSTGDQPSYMRKDGKMSIFTYHLIESLTGHAEPEEGAKEVLVSDIMGHVYRHVPQSANDDWGVEQTPDYQVSGNFPIALLLGGRGLSKGQPAPDPLVELPARASEPAGRRIEVRDGVYVEGQVIGDVAGDDIDKRTIETDGGAFIGDGADIGGGTLVGRDQIVQGDEVRGDKVAGDKIEGHVGDVGSGAQVAIGKDIKQTITQAPTELSAAERIEIARLLAELKDQLASLDILESKKLVGQELVGQLEQELTRTDKPPDASTIKVVGDWLLENVPALAGTITGVFVNPVVGKAVKAAGSIAAEWVGKRFGGEA